jgi:ubiquinone/menaquinone biosynthesis C-methylase UbiE
LTVARTKAVRERYDRLAHEYDARWAAYITASVGHTLERLKLAPGEAVLDVGCGTGAMEKVCGDAIIGVDLSPLMLARAGGTRAAGDVAALPFREQSFDAAVSVSSLHYWIEPVGALTEIRRVLKKTGRMVITDWCDDYLACRACDRILRLVNRAYVRAYRARELERLLTQAGFTAIDVTRYKIGWLWGLMTAVATA